MGDIRPSRRQSVRAADLDGNELLFAFSISKKLYRCPGCGDPIDVGREHVLVRYLSGPRGRLHQHWHAACTDDRFTREVRSARLIPAR